VAITAGIAALGHEAAYAVFDLIKAYDEFTQDNDPYCSSSYKIGHETGLSFGGSGSSVGLIMQPAFDVASGDTGLSVS